MYNLYQNILYPPISSVHNAWVLLAQWRNRRGGGGGGGGAECPPPDIFHWEIFADLLRGKEEMEKR